VKWIGDLICLAVLVQSLELARLKPWPWTVIVEEVPRVLRPILLSSRWLLGLRIIAAVLAFLFPHPIVIAVLLLTTWAIAIRWRGTFNGGSDTMIFHILAAWLVSATFPSTEKICISYVAIQMILSYFVAGMAKLLNRDWRTGKALNVFLERVGYTLPLQICFILGWGLVTFEVLSPLALVTPATFVAMALLFHIANVYIFGLNHFFFAWLAGYPALFMMAGWFH
jgi:hypothetical protein